MNRIKPGFCAMICSKYTKGDIADYLAEVKYKEHDPEDDIEANKKSFVKNNQYGPRRTNSKRKGQSPQKMQKLKPQNTKRLVSDTINRLESEDMATIDPDTLAEV